MKKLICLLFVPMLLTACQNQPAPTVQTTPDVKSELIQMFSTELSKPAADLEILIDDQEPLYVRGRLKVDGAEKFFLASRYFQEWEVVAFGKQIYACSAISLHKFPARMIRDCYLDEPSKVLVSIKKDTGAAFDNVEKEVDFNWQAKDGVKNLRGYKMFAEQISGEEVTAAEEVLKKLGYELNQYNVGDGTVESSRGYDNGKIACLLNIKNSDQADVNSALTLEIKCAEIK